eukprot:GILJ01008216.1.p1 GENE.GILJ01008216.1~~GILJ01008216.1.p1  ORF type:complete len:811 (+),score=138.75 GILJ01008216.1:45-2477(+)
MESSTDAQNSTSISVPLPVPAAMPMTFDKFKQLVLDNDQAGIQEFLSILLKSKDIKLLRTVVQTSFEMMDQCVYHSINVLIALRDKARFLSRIVLESIEDVIEQRKAAVAEADYQRAASTWRQLNPDVLADFFQLFKLNNVVPTDELVEYAKQVLTEDVADAASVITQFSLQTFFPSESVLSKLVHLKRFDKVTAYVGADADLKRCAIDLMRNEHDAKVVAKYIAEFGLDPADYPDITILLEKRSVSWMVRSGKIDMNSVADLVEGKEELQHFFVKELIKTGRLAEASHYVDSHDELTLSEPLSTVLREHRTSGAALLLKAEEDGVAISAVQTSVVGDSPAKPAFTDRHLTLPFGMDSVQFIDSVSVLESAMVELRSSTMLGMDAEWRPSMSQFQKLRPSILQIANGQRAFILDLIQLEGAYDAFLTELFLSESIIKIGFAFTGDLALLRESNPELKCFERINCYIEAETAFKRTSNGSAAESGKKGLSYLVESWLGLGLCKRNQISNWERRPLTVEQLQYAALDAHCLVEMANRFMEDSKQTLHDIRATAVVLAANQNADKPKRKTVNGVRQKRRSSSGDAPTTESAVAPTSDESLLEEGMSIAEFAAKKVEQEKAEWARRLAGRPPTFIVDSMMGKLARQLRGLGVDTLYLSTKNHRVLVEIAEEDRRIILTRDRNFVARRFGPPCYLVKANKPKAQLREIRDMFQLSVAEDLICSRCSACNGNEWVLRRPEDLHGEVSEVTRTSYDEFWQCGQCKKLYWAGKMYDMAQEHFRNLRLDVDQPTPRPPRQHKADTQTETQPQSAMTTSG